MHSQTGVRTTPPLIRLGIQQNWQEDKFDWAVEVGELRAKYGLNLFLDTYVSMDEFNADRNLIYVRNDTNYAMLTDITIT